MDCQFHRGSLVQIGTLKQTSIVMWENNLPKRFNEPFIRVQPWDIGKSIANSTYIRGRWNTYRDSGTICKIYVYQGSIYYFKYYPVKQYNNVGPNYGDLVLEIGAVTPDPPYVLCLLCTLDGRTVHYGRIFIFH